MALYASGFSGYARDLLPWETDEWVGKAIGVGLIALVVLVNLVGAKIVGRSEQVVISVELVILVVFVVLAFSKGDWSRFGQHGGDGALGVLSAAGLLYVCYEGFGVVTNSAGDMADPRRELPRALYLAVGVVMAIYVAVSVAIVVVMRLAEIDASSGHVLAEAGRAVLGRAGFLVVGVAALLATSSAVNATMFGSANLAYVVAKRGELPAVLVGELAAAHPLRERLQELLALAIYRSGRQADARRHLRDELGLEPSRPLRDLESAILAQDPALDRPESASAPVSTSPAPTAASASEASRGPAPVGPVGAPRAAGGGAAVAGATPFVGRDEELAVLVRALDAAPQDASIVVIEGDPGIGKTRLADQLRLVALDRGALVAWGRSDEGGAAPALWPWLAPLRAVAEHLGEPPPAFGDLAANLGSLSSGQADAVRYEWFESVAGMLERAAATVPVVVLLDDLQWADETSLELLAYLARRLERGVVVVGTMRVLEMGRNDALTDALAAIARRATSRRLRLRGLTEEATSELLAAVAQEPVRSEVAAAVHARAEGNPFYAIELARLIDEEGDSHVPGTVGDVIRRRVARLPEPTSEALTVAAVVGRDVPVERLAAVTDTSIDETLEMLEPAVVQRLLVESPEIPGALRFSHALVREVLLEDLTPLRRARLHLRVADAIEAAGAGVDELEILAEHLWQAAPIGVGRRAADALERAAEVAIARVAYATAEDLLLKTIRLRRADGASPEDEAAELRAIYHWLEVARARRYFSGADRPELIARAKELAECCGERDVLLDIIWFEWSACATSSRIEDGAAIAAAHRTLTADDEDPWVRARGFEIEGVLHWLRGEIGAAARSLDTCVELLPDIPPGPGLRDELAVVAHAFAMWTNAACGNLAPDDAIAAADAMIAGATGDRFALASICGFAATTAISLGRWEDLGRFTRMGRDADPDAQFGFWAGQVFMQQAVALAWQGDLDLAVETFAAGMDRYTEVGGRSGSPTFEAALALHLARRGDLDRARTHAASARQRLDRFGERWNESTVLIAEAVVAGLGGDEDEGRRLLRAAFDVATAQEAPALAERARIEAELCGWTLD
jgi:tellurite resistance protein